MKITYHPFRSPLRPYRLVWRIAYATASSGNDCNIHFVIKNKVADYLSTLPARGWWKFKWRAVSFPRHQEQPFSFYVDNGRVRHIGRTPAIWFSKKSDILVMKLALGNDLDN